MSDTNQPKPAPGQPGAAQNPPTSPPSHPGPNVPASPPAIGQAGPAAPAQVLTAPAAQPATITGNSFSDLAERLNEAVTLSQHTAEALTADRQLPFEADVSAGASSAFFVAVLCPGGGFSLRSGVRNWKTFPPAMAEHMRNQIEMDRQLLIRNTLLALGIKLGQL